MKNIDIYYKLKVLGFSILCFFCLVPIILLLGADIGDPIPPEPWKEPEKHHWSRVDANKFLCTNISVYDADTFTADINIKDFNVVLLKQKIRTMGFDACEISKIRQSVIVTDSEIRKGKEAKKYVEELFSKYKVFIAPAGRDNYGRLLCYVYLTDDKHPNYFVALQHLIYFNKFDRSQQ